MLTVSKIKALRSGEKPYKRSDGFGLYLLVTPAGGKLWRFKYRLNGREKGFSLGRWPGVSLKMARRKREDYQRQLGDGIDPAAARKAAERAQATDTFQAIAEEWLTTQTHLSDHTATQMRNRLTNWVYPALGQMPIATIEPWDVLSMLQQIQAKGRLETMHRVKQLCTRIANYAVVTQRATSNPTIALSGALASPVTRHRSALLDPKRVGGLLRAINDYDGHAVIIAAFNLVALTFVRSIELRHATWSEFDLDSPTPTWRIPAARMKMRQDHMVPLSRQAVSVLKSLQPLTGRDAFVLSIRPKRPLSGNTLNMALRAMGYTGDVMTTHGFRAMASTLLHEQGFAPEVIELQLAHAQPTVRATYNRSARLAERRSMMQAWADYLDQLRAGADVLPFVSR